MRTLFLALMLTLAACGQEAPPPTMESVAPSRPELGDNPDAALLDGALEEGRWSFLGDGGTISAAFGPPESEFLFSLSCNQPTGEVTATVEHELYPDQDTTLALVTAARALEFPARSFNDGLPAVVAGIRGEDPKLATLAAPQERFAVTAAAEVSVLPWDESVARVLAACAG